MDKIKILLLICFLSAIYVLHAQDISLNKDRLEAVNVFMSTRDIKSQVILKVIKDTAIHEFDEPTFVKIKDVNFTNGTIEVKLLSRLLPDAPDFSRGFIGIAFRVNEDNSKFESIYLRPTNSRSDNQLRRNHSIQYFAYPDFKFQRLRIESPEMYESYADIALNEWIKIRIQINKDKAKLYINDSNQPSLIVNDLKLGSNVQGAIGLFVDVGTEGFFKELKISKN